MTQGAIATNGWNIVYVADIRVLYFILPNLWEYFRVSQLYQALGRANQCYKDYDDLWQTNPPLSHNGSVGRKTLPISGVDFENDIWYNQKKGVGHIIKKWAQANKEKW